MSVTYCSFSSGWSGPPGNILLGDPIRPVADQPVVGCQIVVLGSPRLQHGQLPGLGPLPLIRHDLTVAPPTEHQQGAGLIQRLLPVRTTRDFVTAQSRTVIGFTNVRSCGTSPAYLAPPGVGDQAHAHGLRLLGPLARLD